MIYYSKGTVQEYEQIPDEFAFEDEKVYKYQGVVEIEPHMTYYQDNERSNRVLPNGNYVVRFYHEGSSLFGIIPSVDKQLISEVMSGEIYFKNPTFHPVANIEIEVVAAYLQ